ncbi:MAG: phytanoyl-CoA dioxygenase family protein [Pyrinomonadaceae bacterium]|nr:phytanoyl-CoA dioxygenase family protein [Pyrinomonadaceae bacterium]
MNTESFDERGFAMIDNAFENQAIERLTEQLSRLDFGESAKRRSAVAFGVRNLLNVAPFVKDFSESDSVRKIIEPIAGENVRVVRAIYFDKTTEANWKVPFHQDLTITVKERKDVDGFVSWTTKASIWHVQPPTSVIENILALRVHLDDADESNGALRVIAGSHNFGRLGAEQIEKFKLTGEIVTCPMPKNGAMLLRPLLLHASSAATNASHRRVVHFEFSAAELPGNLEWFGS